MAEKSKEEDQKRMEKMEELEKNIKTLSEKTGRNRNDVMDKLLKITDDKEKEEGENIGELAKMVESLGGGSENNGGSRSMLQDMMEANAVQKLTEKMSGGSENDGMGIDFNKILAFNMMKDMMKPDMEEVMMKQNMMQQLNQIQEGGEKEGSNDMLKEFLKMQAEQQKAQQEQNAQLMQTMFGGKLEGLEKQIQSNREETDQKLNKAVTAIQQAQASSQESGKSLVDEIKEDTEKKEALRDWAKEQGMTDQTEGKGVDWERILDKVGNVVEKGAEAAAKRPPQPKQMSPVPVSNPMPPSQPNVSESEPVKTETNKEESTETEEADLSSEEEKIASAGSGSSEGEPYQDKSGRWHSPDGPFISKGDAKKLLNQ